MKVFFFFICLSVFCTQAYAATPPPPWMSGDMPVKTNSSYYFRVIQGEGSTFAEARNNAAYGLVSELARGQGVVIKGNDLLESIIQSSKGKYEEQTQQHSAFKIETDAFKTSFEMVDEYVDKGGLYWFLFEVALDPENVSFDKVEFTTNYGARAVLRSVVVPGWGQMYKRSVGKGVTVLSLQVVTVAGVVACNSLSNNYYNKTLAERNNTLREQYQDKSTTYRNVRNGFIVAAGAVYAYNIVDAIAAKGAKRYKVSVSSAGLTLSMKL